MISVFYFSKWTNDINYRCPKPHYTQSEPFAESWCTFAIHTIGHNNDDDDENEKKAWKGRLIFHIFMNE